MSSVILDTARLPEDLLDALTQLSALTGEPNSAIAENALRHYLCWRIPQLADLGRAIDAADQGDFADEGEADAFFKRHGA